MTLERRIHHDLGQRLFSFAVLGDTHIEARHATREQPRPNQRCERILSALARRRPSFVVHLGDLVHPLPDSDEAEAAHSAAKALFRQFQCPVFYTPGNHDIGDKHSPYMPAVPVSADWLKRWTKRFGSDRSVLDCQDCRVMLFNSVTINADRAADERLLAWLEKCLSEAPLRRVFIATHYPIFLHDEAEIGHYDNIDEPARCDLLRLFRAYKVEAVFTGHIHSILYTVRGDTEFYGVPATSFVRRDYSELFRIEPLAEYGREDPAKLGFFWIDVHKGGHIARFIRLDDISELNKGRLPGHPKDGCWTPLGVNLRHPWRETVTFPFNQPVATFARKRVRNDYFVQALFELGLRDLRVPIEDLLQPEAPERLGELIALGFRTIGVTVGIPSMQLLKTLSDRGYLLGALEVVHRPDELNDVIRQVSETSSSVGFALWSDELKLPGGVEGQNPKSHRVQHGYNLADSRLSTVASALADGAGRRGLVFRYPIEAYTAEVAHGIEALTTALGLQAAVLLVWASDDPSGVRNDDGVLNAEIDRLLALAAQYPSPRLILDTFIDIDRGYHVRSGLLDRRANPRAPGRLIRARRFVEIAESADPVSMPPTDCTAGRR